MTRVGLVDFLRVGGVISTLGVLSGALAGGIENRMALRHLALFGDRLRSHPSDPL